MCDGSDDARLLAQIEERRNDLDFMGRLRRMVDDDRDVLDRLAAPMDSVMPCNEINREALQRDLLAVFEKHGVSVGVGLTRDGVAIRSQTPAVDACNISAVTALPGKRS